MHEDIERFNIVRAHLKGKEMSRKELKEVLKKQFGYPATDQMIMASTKGANAPITKLSRGKYMVNKEPVYKDRLQTMANDYYATMHKDGVVSKRKGLSEEDCILFLKSKGYKILKAETKYVEI